MLEVIIGALIGIVASVAVAEAYHRRAGRQFDEQIVRLADQNDALGALLEEVRDVLNNVERDSEVTRRHVVAGTSDDPDWPYK